MQQYADAKALPIELLQNLGVRDAREKGVPVVRIPYLDEAGSERAIRLRVGLETSQGPRFKWKLGNQPLPYGLWRMDQVRTAGRVLLVEGESDAQTLWAHGYPAIGLPGASTWKEDWVSHFDGIDEILVIVEPDGGGEAVKRWLATSPLRERAKLVLMPPEVDGVPTKDPSALHILAPDLFTERFDAILDAAIPWHEFEEAEHNRAARHEWDRCQELAEDQDILERFGHDLQSLGYCGDLRPAKLTYLVVTSRLLGQPVSIAVKGPSSAGKSFLVERVLEFFPEEAFYALTAMSERALAYSQEPLSHRILVIYEAAGMRGDMASYLLRSLLSEGRIKYEFVEKTAAGMTPRLIEREGPTGLIVTTTAVRLHPENETRLLSLTLTDSPTQTAGVLKALADEDVGRVDLQPWRSLQSWLETRDSRVTIPFARTLAEVIPPVSVRLRRDFKSILGLIRAHALLHQAIRDRDGAGRIIATVGDYTVVRDLVADLVAEGVESLVPETVRTTVTVVGTLVAEKTARGASPAHVSVSEIARRIGIDRSSASRRVKVAVSAGYLRNLERNPRADAQIVTGDPLPAEVEILPTAERLEACMRAAGLEEMDAAPDDDWGEIRVTG
jgi:hypothetical protein